MVNNNYKLIDEGVLKYTPEVKMPSKESIEWTLIHRFLNCDKRIITRHVEDKETFITVNVESENAEFINPTDRYKNFKMKFYDAEYTTALKQEYSGTDWKSYANSNKQIITQHWGWQSMLDYIGVIPFSPSVMINISPEWAASDLAHEKKGKKGMPGSKMWMKLMIPDFEKMIENYLRTDNRYDYASYVLECGGKGNHLHAHIVAHINPKMLKSVRTHIKEGRHVPALKARAGHGKLNGLINGKGISITMCNCEMLTNDKLEYLIEEKKPDGHKNKCVLMPVKKLVFN